MADRNHPETMALAGVACLGLLCLFRITSTNPNHEKTGITAAIYAVLIVLVAIPSIGIWVFRSKMEAKAYNRVTGSNVTTWEAMWIELRVQGDPR